MLSDLKYSLRVAGIAWTLARYDALIGLEALNLSPLVTFSVRLIRRRRRGLRPGQRLSLALQSLGPSYIKLGQALSTRADLVGEEIAEDLTELQDRLPPFPGKVARATVEDQLGASIDSLFTQFDEEAHAAASIAQVHFAVTNGGREVAVKVLRPGIEEAFQRDIDLFFWLARFVERRLPHYRRLKPVAVIATFAETVRFELDLRFEAAAAEELRANTKNDTDFYVPIVEWDLTARRVLTTERIRGFSAGDVAGMRAAGIDPDVTMQRAATSFFNQVFRDGFFHADMHPGNLFVLPDGRLAPVDFGIMGRIDHYNQLILAEILWSFMKGDFMRVAKLHREAGWIPPHVSVEHFAQAARAVGQPIMGKPLNEISVGRLLGQLLHIAETFEMEAQPHLFLLQKTMMTAEGVGRGLNPNVNMWKLSEPLIKQWASEHLSGPARLKLFVTEARDTLRDAPRVLREAKEFLDKIQQEGVTLSPQSLAHLEEQRAAHQRQWLRLAWLSFALAAGTAAFFVTRNL
jgi:ubiquinone biosynthesis protein